MFFMIFFAYNYVYRIQNGTVEITKFSTPLFDNHELFILCHHFKTENLKSTIFYF